jgi:hypothetical protein
MSSEAIDAAIQKTIRDLQSRLAEKETNLAVLAAEYDSMRERLVETQAQLDRALHERDKHKAYSWEISTRILTVQEMFDQLLRVSRDAANGYKPELVPQEKPLPASDMPEQDKHIMQNLASALGANNNKHEELPQ